MWSLALGRRTLLTPRALLCLALSGLIGLSPYAYCVVQGGPDAAWGSWGAQRSVGGLLTHMLRREYGTFRLANTDSTTDSEFWPRLAAYLAAVPGPNPNPNPNPNPSPNPNPNPHPNRDQVRAAADAAAQAPWVTKWQGSATSAEVEG